VTKAEGKTTTQALLQWSAPEFYEIHFAGAKFEGAGKLSTFANLNIAGAAKFEGSSELEGWVLRNPRIVEDTDDIKPRRGARRTHNAARIIAIGEELLRSGVDDSRELFFDRVAGELERLRIPDIPGLTWMKKHLGPIYRRARN